MQPMRIRTSKTSRRNPLVVAARQRQAGPHRDGREKAVRKVAQREIRASMHYRRSAQEADTDE